MKKITNRWYKNAIRRTNKEIDTENQKIFNNFLQNHKRVISK